MGLDREVAKDRGLSTFYVRYTVLCTVPLVPLPYTILCPHGSGSGAYVVVCTIVVVVPLSNLTTLLVVVESRGTTVELQTCAQ